MATNDAGVEEVTEVLTTVDGEAHVVAINGARSGVVMATNDAGVGGVTEVLTSHVGEADVVEINSVGAEVHEEHSYQHTTEEPAETVVMVVPELGEGLAAVIEAQPTEVHQDNLAHDPNTEYQLMEQQPANTEAEIVTEEVVTDAMETVVMETVALETVAMETETMETDTAAKSGEVSEEYTVIYSKTGETDDNVVAPLPEVPHSGTAENVNNNSTKSERKGEETVSDEIFTEVISDAMDLCAEEDEEDDEVSDDYTEIRNKEGEKDEIVVVKPPEVLDTSYARKESSMKSKHKKEIEVVIEDEANDVLEVFPFVCGICSSKFDKIKKYFAHFKAHTGFESALHLCGKGYGTNKSTAVDDLDDENDAELFGCGVCKDTFPSICLLHDHMIKEEMIADYRYYNHVVMPIYGRVVNSKTILKQNEEKNKKNEAKESPSPTKAARGRPRIDAAVVKKEAAEEKEVEQDKDSPTLVKRSRGRPRKYPKLDEDGDDKKEAAETPTPDKPKRGRGRPKRVVTEDSEDEVVIQLETPATGKRPRGRPRLDQSIKKEVEDDEEMEQSRKRLKLDSTESAGSTEDTPQVIETPHSYGTRRQSAIKSGKPVPTSIVSKIKEELGEKPRTPCITSYSKATDNQQIVRKKLELSAKKTTPKVVDQDGDNEKETESGKKSTENKAKEAEPGTEAAEDAPTNEEVNKDSTKPEGETAGAEETAEASTSVSQDKADGTAMEESPLDDEEQQLLMNMDLSDPEDPTYTPKGEKQSDGEDSTRSKMAECEVCGIVMKRKMLARHKVVHQEERNHECDLCGKFFKSQSGVTDHKRVVHTDEVYSPEVAEAIKASRLNSSRKKSESVYRNEKIPCQTCGKVLRRKMMARHRVVHQQDRNHECNRCGKTFKSHSHLTDHNRVVHAERDQECEICEKKFKTKGALIKHVHLHLKKGDAYEGETGIENTFKDFDPEKLVAMGRAICDICGKVVLKSSMKKHKFAHTNIRNFKCDICGAAFKLATHVKEHVDVVHLKLEKYVCEICDARFKSTKNLSVHRNGHLDPADPYYSEAIVAKLQREEREKALRLKHAMPKTVSCDICGKTVLLKRLNRHKGIHKKTRDFSCDICHKTFITQRYVNDHKLKVHTTARQFCEICGQFFKGKSYMEKHKQIHGPRDKECDVCGKTFTTDFYLKLHKQTHTDRKAFKCEECPSAFSSKSRLREHMAEKHDIGDKQPCKYCFMLFPSRAKARAHERRLHEGFEDKTKVKKKRRMQIKEEPIYGEEYHVIVSQDYGADGEDPQIKILTEKLGQTEEVQMIDASTGVEGHEEVTHEQLVDAVIQSGEHLQEVVQEVVQVSEEGAQEDGSGTEIVQHVLEIPETADRVCALVMYPDGSYRLVNPADIGPDVKIVAEVATG